jgi:hypothetical protein
MLTAYSSVSPFSRPSCSSTGSRPSHNTYIHFVSICALGLRTSGKHPPPETVHIPPPPEVHTLNPTSPDVAPYDNTRVRPSTVGQRRSAVPRFYFTFKDPFRAAAHLLRSTSRYVLLHQYLIFLPQLYQDKQRHARRPFRIEPQK